MMERWDTCVDRIILDPATSYWLQDALVVLRQRDPVDAVNDAEMLADIMRERFDAMVEVHEAMQGALAEVMRERREDML
jgi:transposase